VSVNDVDYEFIHSYKEQYPITELVKLTSLSRSGFYKKSNNIKRKSREELDKPLLNMMLSLYITHGGNLGNIRYKDELFNTYGVVVNVKRITRMRRMYNLPLKTMRRKFKSHKQLHVLVDNVLNRNFKALKPGIKFSIDITYLEVLKPHKNFLFLCAIKDLYNNEIVAYSIGQNQKLELVYQTLEQLKEKGFVKGAILHSDQGVQFTNPSYRNRLKEMHLTQSMSRRGNCWDNACIESFFGKLKTEMPGFSIPETEEEMINSVTNYIIYYNQVRPQLKFKMSPVAHRLKLSA
jgi:transposase InsO family protein